MIGFLLAKNVVPKTFFKRRAYTKAILFALVGFWHVNGSAQSYFSDSLILTPEKSKFQKTSTHSDVMRFLDAAKKKSDKIHVFNMGYSKERREIPVAVISRPKITSPEQAKASGKLVVYIQANIHAGEIEGKEALMMLMRDILWGDKQQLLDSQIILLAPIYNTDANDKMARGLRPSQEDSPPETGERESSEGYDLNRDGMKMDAIETKALFKSVIVPWDPQIFVDMHTTNGTWHAYSLTWAPSYHSCGSYRPFEYSYYTMLPNITDSVFKKHNLRFGVYGDYEVNENWPPKKFYTYNHHPRYLVNQFGLRNRMAILSETFAHDRFYERINSSYVFIEEILSYTGKHASEIRIINSDAENETIRYVKNMAGKVKKGTRFRMVLLDTIDRFPTYDFVRSTDSTGQEMYYRTGKIVEYDGVKYYAGFEASSESVLPKGYVIPGQYSVVIENLKDHGIQVIPIKKKTKYSGESYRVMEIDQAKLTYQKHKACTLKGEFYKSTATFNKGDWYVDMAQPLANLIFYLLEPESDDGLVYWNFFDEFLKKIPETKNNIFPVFKHY
ncbi:MAG: M14 family metallopeptidase [Flavobacteriales bacterium]|nr:M14 family metallopeptidase [Flavobacteriales bacterium]